MKLFKRGTIRTRLNLLFLCLLVVGITSASFAETPLNFLVVLIDDMGMTDLGCYGSTFYETPHLDRLAREGMKFTQAYSACTVCSPTRAALLTGKYPARLHVTDWIAGHVRPFAKLRVPEWTQELPAGETTIAEVLRGKGYATAQFGKWHLGRNQPATAHGFDLSVADNGMGQPASYLAPFKNPNLPDGPPGEELTGRLTREAAEWIGKNKDRPWFLYLPHFAVHTPLGGKPEAGATPHSAMREGDWRLVHFYEDDRVELYNLYDDPAEKNDLAAKQPERAGKLHAQLEAWRESVGAQPPTPNPNHDATRDRPQ